MATLLSLPREIRDQILREVIFIQHPLPASPSVSQEDRICLRNTVDPYWAQDTNIYVEKGLTGNAQMAILRTNRQLRTETEELLSRLEGTPYRLDMMFVKECGLLPTWLSFPGRRRNIDTVHAQVRIFNPPEDINPEWLESAYFRGDSDGSTRTCWNILFLLTIYLLNGIDDIPVHYNNEDTSDDEEAANETEETNIEIGPTVSAFHNKKFARNTIKTLILDVLEPPPNIHPATLGPADPLPQQQQEARRNIFGHSIFRHSNDWVGEHSPAPGGDGAGDRQSGLAYTLARSLCHAIDLGVDADFPYELYSRLIFEHIGTIEIRVNGVESDKFDMTARLCMRFGAVLPSDPTWDGVPSIYTEWFESAVAKRKRDGLWNEGEYERLRLLWA